MKRDIRQKKVAELLQHTLSQIINFEMWDPRIKQVTIFEIKVSADLQNAKIFIGCGEDKKNTLEALNHAVSFLRRRLKEEAVLKYVPKLTFIIDDLEEKANRIDNILKELNQKN